MRKTLMAGALVALGALLLSFAGTASAAKSGSVTAIGTCTAASTSSKLKANQPSNGLIEVEFQVDQNVNGQVWRVVLKDNGSTFLNKLAKTKAPSGSFTVRASVADAAGADAISAVATNQVSGATCTASLSI